jgi:hypothetical protein
MKSFLQQYEPTMISLQIVNNSVLQHRSRFQLLQQRDITITHVHIVAKMIQTMTSVNIFVTMYSNTDLDSYCYECVLQQ